MKKKRLIFRKCHIITHFINLIIAAENVLFKMKKKIKKKKKKKKNTKERSMNTKFYCSFRFF